MEVTGRRGRRRKQLLERILVIQRKGTRSHSVENSFERGYGFVVRQTTE